VHRSDDHFHGRDGTAADLGCRLRASLAPGLSSGALKRKPRDICRNVRARMRLCTTRG
jgi:hypothetical protein